MWEPNPAACDEGTSSLVISALCVQGLAACHRGTHTSRTASSGPGHIHSQREDSFPVGRRRSAEGQEVSDGDKHSGVGHVLGFDK
jgi:hypothetical protein